MKIQQNLSKVLPHMVSIFCLLLVVSCTTKSSSTSDETSNEAEDDFKGKIALDIRDSEADWSAYTPKSAPKDAPNILFILYDDTGLGAWSPYGGRINMPTMDKLAANGLTYTQWHTTALCSPTRSTILTGRNHHLNGMASITETADGYPGSNGRVPDDCAPFAEILRDNGWSTFWIGKNHNVPEQDIAPGASRTEWPTQIGFDRFYGFLGGETNNWYPDLVEDNHFIEAPATPEEGYHLSKDLADQAITMLRDKNATNPSKPFYMWFNPGANHAPHHSPAEYTAKYKGKFDDGYEAYREWVVKRMKEKGIIPEDTGMADFNPMPEDQANPGDFVRPWDELNADEKRLFARMAEVYAGFSEYTDAQVGRIIDYLEETGQLENTIVLYAADNGASGEGSPNGSVNENKFFNGYPDELAENMKYLDVLGGPDTYNHFPTGWAAAFSAPFKMFKRYSQYAGGTNDPLVISWPKGIKARGEIRHQYHHSVDIVPTLLEACGIEFPEVYKGAKQTPLSGTSMVYTFDAKPNDATKKEVQYFAMLGTRGIWKDGWKAAAVHAPISGKGHFDEDVWELYHVAEDRSESNNLAEENPEKLQELIDEWFHQAEINKVLPLDDRSAAELLTIERPAQEAAKDRYVYYPNTAPVPEGVAVNVRGRDYKILANVEIKDPNVEGVLFAHGSRFGGHSLFIKDKKLYYVYNFLGIKPEQVFTSNVSLKPGKYTLGMEFSREKAGEYGESIGNMKLYVNEEVVAEGPMRTQPAKFTLSGDGLCVGYDSGDNVSNLYEAPGEFEGGSIQGVAVTVEGEPYVNLEAEAKRMLMTH
ncbi:arylsulfatase A family protein [Galbibacter orientalis DSM 19592]|uniref:Arylsulfatase A family protein n=1 Tax=Galbibacter orientalis DSM 19592 TaxID=926559 RepID=I3CAY4_9FLAO|nr:arylsulfatase [Galbibacter orientalis]EIJ40777.1 arylsulfatase A family protein [Galbibacter orientalis DSM 19592]